LKEPTFDADGYPTEETLDIISTWDIQNITKDVEELLLYVKRAWRYPEYFTTSKKRFRRFKGGSLIRRYFVSTGGWSGNESLISALVQNHVFWLLSWQQSERGGHYIFEVSYD
jgi:hypothetical protein